MFHSSRRRRCKSPCLFGASVTTRVSDVRSSGACIHQEGRRVRKRNKEWSSSDWGGVAETGETCETCECKRAEVEEAALGGFNQGRAALNRGLVGGAEWRSVGVEAPLKPESRWRLSLSTSILSSLCCNTSAEAADDLGRYAPKKKTPAAPREAGRVRGRVSGTQNAQFPISSGGRGVLALISRWRRTEVACAVR